MNVCRRYIAEKATRREVAEAIEEWNAATTEGLVKLGAAMRGDTLGEPGRGTGE